MIAHGYADMVTPYALTRYISTICRRRRRRTASQLKLYRGGHMFYIDPQSRKAFSADAAAFYRGE